MTTIYFTYKSEGALYESKRVTKLIKILFVSSKLFFLLFVNRKFHVKAGPLAYF